MLAGVIPRLQEQERWLALRMRPGRHPIRALASLLRALPAGLALVAVTRIRPTGRQTSII